MIQSFHTCCPMGCNEFFCAAAPSMLKRFSEVGRTGMDANLGSHEQARDFVRPIKEQRAQGCHGSGVLPRCNGRLQMVTRTLQCNPTHGTPVSALARVAFASRRLQGCWVVFGKVHAIGQRLLQQCTPPKTAYRWFPGGGCQSMRKHNIPRRTLLACCVASNRHKDASWRMVEGR